VPAIVGNILNVVGYVHKSYQFVNIDLDRHCIEQDFEVCAIKLSNSPINLCVLSLYRSPSGNFDTFILKLEEILNILFQNQVNLVICGEFNANFMTNNTKRYKIISLLKRYNLDYIVDFPTRMGTCSALSIDNILLDRNRTNLEGRLLYLFPPEGA
jgi:hypothetical protein